ncbi:hypothetical protein ACODNH_07060 [Haloarcula sp. NS06]|uniref:hypothetical protein n=1 Tax=Haloarcula sp. NS06 TaxID=3409688 RepID=UPI003DA77162
MTEITRRRISLPVDFDKRLIELAEDHHSSNVSGFIRCAVQSYESSLDEQERRKEMLSTLEELRREIDELRQAVEDPDDKTRMTGPPPAKLKTQNESKLNPASVQRSVQSVLLDEGKLELAELVEAVDYGVLETQKATEALIEKELMEKESNDETVEYKIKK